MLKNRFSIVLLLFSSLSMYARDVIIEFKGAGFLPTNDTYKDIYGYGGIYGLEGTFNLGRDYLYGFVSLNFLKKNGDSIGLCSPTQINLFEMGLGLKCLVPFCVGDVYFGLGALPTYIKTKDCSPFVRYENKKWTTGGIAKFGVLFDVPHNFVVDIFADYAFVKAKFCCTQSSTGYVQPNTARLNGVILGAGFGYRF